MEGQGVDTSLLQPNNMCLVLKKKWMKVMIKLILIEKGRNDDGDDDGDYREN